MMPGSDIDTIANADDLWKLVHLVQDAITPEGQLKSLLSGNGRNYLVELRALADELDPDYGAHGY